MPGPDDSKAATWDDAVREAAMDDDPSAEPAEAAEAAGPSAENGPAGPWGKIVPLDLSALTDSPPPRRWLLMRPDQKGDMVGLLPAGKVGILSAPGGTGKTMALAGLALAVACDKNWLRSGGGRTHHPGFRPFTLGRVALLLGEEDADDIRSRLYYTARMMALTHEQREAAARRILVAPLAGENVALVEEDGELSARASALYDRLASMSDPANPWALILVDPLSRFGGIGAETDNALATRAIQALERLTRLPGSPTVLMAHHERKGGGEGAEAVRGSSAIVDGARWVARLSPVRTKTGNRWTTKNGDRCVAFEVVKTNYGPPLDDKCYLVLDGRYSGALRVPFAEEAPTDEDLDDTPKREEKQPKTKDKPSAGGPVKAEL